MARQVQPGGWMAPPQDPKHAVHAQHAGEEESLPPQVGCTPDLLRLWSARNGGAPAAVPAWVQRIVQARPPARALPPQRSAWLAALAAAPAMLAR
jgi:hypothetical protein